MHKSANRFLFLGERVRKKHEGNQKFFKYLIVGLCLIMAVVKLSSMIRENNFSIFSISQIISLVGISLGVFKDKRFLYLCLFEVVGRIANDYELISVYKYAAEYKTVISFVLISNFIDTLAILVLALAPLSKKEIRINKFKLKVLPLLSVAIWLIGILYSYAKIGGMAFDAVTFRTIITYVCLPIALSLLLCEQTENLIAE